MKTSYILKITPLTGLHVGTGVELTPFDYIIAGDGEKGVYLYRFAPEDLVKGMSSKDRMELSMHADNEDIPALRKLFVRCFDEKYILSKAPVSREVAEVYRKSLGTSRNQLVIDGMYRKSDTLSPMIPGSSIKGGIRTALLNEAARKKNKTLPGGKLNFRQFEADLQKDVFGYHDPKNDPFRDLIVRDFLVKGKKAEMVTKMEIYKRDKMAGGWEYLSMQLFAEIIRGKLLGGDATGASTLLIDTDHQDIRGEYKKWRPPRYTFSYDDIVTACNHFYRNEFEEEWDKFYLPSDDGDLREMGERLRQEMEKIDPNKGSFLLRIGRFSQVESMTLEPPLRKPWNKKGYGKTRTLALYGNRHAPLGWVRVDKVKEG